MARFVAEMQSFLDTGNDVGRVAAIKTDFSMSIRKGDVRAELDKQESQFQA